MSEALARAAYETLEPYHLIAYFNPHLKEAQRTAGVDSLGLYVGGRAAPVGRCQSAVVTAMFYNFSPAFVNHGWTAALSAGLPVVVAARAEAMDRSLREALGERICSPELPAIVSALRVGIAEASYAGRPLAAAWAYAPWPDEPHLQLWQATAIAREHRGDGHIAALVLAGLSRVEALVLHEAPHPNPNLRRKTLGRKTIQLTRGWSDADWEGATETLRSRALVDGDGAMTSTGAELYDSIERHTDEAAAGFWAAVPDAQTVLTSARPFVKAVIDAGYLPGTKPKA